MRTQVVSLLAIVFCAHAALAADMPWAAGDLEVPVGDSVSLTEADKTNTSLDIHGTMSVTLGSAGNYTVLGATAAASTIDLGADPDDVGILALSGGKFHGESGNTAMTTIKIGSNGGGDQAKLCLTNTVASFFAGFELTANAQTVGTEFEALSLVGSSASKSYLEVSKVVNNNAKPLVISFEGGALRCFWTGAIFQPTKGDIVLRSVDGHEINIPGGRTNSKMMSASPKGNLRTEGAGDMRIAAERPSKPGSGKGYTYTLNNRAHITWGHEGNAIFDQGGTALLADDDWLPYGSGTGLIKLESTDAYLYPLKLELNGHSQKMNGLVVTAPATLSNTGDLARVTFGTDNVNACVSGLISQNYSNIQFFKTGSGQLLLADATLDNLSVDGGSLVISGAVTVANLTLANTSVSYATKDSSLTTSALDVGSGVTMPLADAAATNVTETALRPLPGVLVEKEGRGYLTCVTPVNAHGADLHVKGGTLRFGGTVRDYTYWRFVAKEAWGGSKTYAHSDPAKSITCYLFLGTLGIFTGEGLPTLYGVFNTSESVGDGVPTKAGDVVDSQPWMTWSSTIGKDYFGTEKDPILGGGTATRPGGGFLYGTAFDDAGELTYDTAQVNQWSSGAIFTNGLLVANDPSTHVTNTCRLKNLNNTAAVSYNLRSIVNNEGTNVPNVKSWELWGSADGTTWEKLDERSGERPYKQSECGVTGRYYNYNRHIPFLFSALKDDWHFTTFGAVEVDAGATLNLSELPDANVAFNGLRVSTAGAGHITKFAPAANGTLYVTHTGETVPRRIILPLTYDTIINAANLSSWSVYVNGTHDPKAAVIVDDQGRMVVHRQLGFAIMFR